MDIIEIIEWMALGFLPMLSLLELITQKLAAGISSRLFLER